VDFNYEYPKLKPKYSSLLNIYSDIFLVLFYSVLIALMFITCWWCL